MQRVVVNRLQDKTQVWRDHHQTEYKQFNKRSKKKTIYPTVCHCYRIPPYYLKNKHRKNVADNMVEFLASNPDADTRSQIIRQGSESMFVMEETGYLGKMNEKDNCNNTI